MDEHYFSEKPTSKVQQSKIELNLRDIHLSLQTASGMFSPGKIDKGTLILIENAKVNHDEKILDLGCSYGAVGLTIAKAYPASQVLLTDINERAIKFATKNKLNNKIQNAEVRKSDEFKKIDETFDVILLNPPQHAGKKLCLSLIEQSFKHLNKGGSLQLVARHNKGGKPLAEFMESLFGNVSDLVKSAGFRVYYAQKK